MSVRSISELSSGCLVHGSPRNVCKWLGQSTRSRYRSKQIITKTLLVHFSVLEGCGWGGRLFEARHLLTSSVLRTGWALIRGWELNRINTVLGIVSHFIIEKMLSPMLSYSQLYGRYFRLYVNDFCYINLV